MHHNFIRQIYASILLHDVVGVELGKQPIEQGAPAAASCKGERCKGEGKLLRHSFQ